MRVLGLYAGAMLVVGAVWLGFIAVLEVLIKWTG